MFKQGLEQPKVKKEKKWKCPKCSIIFPDHVGLRQHILEAHKLEKLSLSQVVFKLFLTQVKTKQVFLCFYLSGLLVILHTIE